MAKHQRRPKEAAKERAKTIRAGIYESRNGRRSYDKGRSAKAGGRHESILSPTAQTSTGQISYATINRHFGRFFVCFALPYRYFAGEAQIDKNAIYVVPYRAWHTIKRVLCQNRGVLRHT